MHSNCSEQESAAMQKLILEVIIFLRFCDSFNKESIIVTFTHRTWYAYLIKIRGFPLSKLKAECVYCPIWFLNQLL